jgi:hypothetical protein
MSHRKTKLIQEKNILLERKYILEQAPPPPPPAPATPAPGAVPPPAPATPTTGTTAPNTSTTGTTVPTSTEKKITKDDVMKAQSCSLLKIDKTKNEEKTMKIDGKDIIYFLNSENKNMVFCSDYKKKFNKD